MNSDIPDGVPVPDLLLADLDLHAILIFPSLASCVFLKLAYIKLYAYDGAGGTRPLAIKENRLLVCGELELENREYEPLVDIYCRIVGFES